MHENWLPKRKRIFICIVVVVVSLIFFTLYIGNTKYSSALTSSTSGLRKSQAAFSEPITSARTSSRPEKRQLLLVTKGRSGSSYISSIINNDRGVFYTFEPLAFLDDVDNKDLYQDKIKGILKLYLQCDLTGVDALDMNSTFHVSTKHGKKFIKCQRKYADGFTHIQCLLDYVKSCQKRKLTFSKVIRLPMRFAQDLLETMPGLKIIYLIRDPRAVLYSQRKHLKNIVYAWGKEIEPDAKRHCEELREDFSEIHELNKLFPGRIQVIRYENGAVDMFSYAKEIYDFIELDFTDETEDYISYLQSPDDREDKRAYGLRRSNPSEVINKWRLIKGSYEAAKKIDKYCKKLYPVLGYIKVKSYEQLVSLDKSLYKKGFRISL